MQESLPDQESVLEAALSGPLAQARAQITLWQTQAAAQGLALRQPPPEPTSCCGRGCNGCVWEGFYDALAFWIEDAQAAISSSTPA